MQELPIHLGDIIFPSTVDYPGHSAITVFLRGCPLRCPYCCNHHLQNPGEPQSIIKVEDIIDRYAHMVDAVIVSGGEPAIQPFQVRQISDSARWRGLKMGMHTSGIDPSMLNWLITIKALDAVMLDIKAPFSKYAEAAGSQFDNIGGIIKLSSQICEQHRSKGDLEYYECRTTLYPGMTVEDVVDIIQSIEGYDKYVLQQGRPSMSVNPDLQKQPFLTLEEIRAIAKTTVERTGKHVVIRDGGWEEKI